MANNHGSTHTTAGHAGHDAHMSIRGYFVVFGGLLVLMVLTVLAWWLEKNLFHVPEAVGVAIAMAIAIAKTLLIVFYFMHLNVASKLTKVFAVSSFFFLAIMFVITMGDYIARGWPALPGPLP